jgi:hypothetical protein
VRVVFLTHNYPRWPGDLSGAFLATLAAGLVRRGVEVRVLAPSDEGQGGEEERDGVFVRRVRYASRRLETIAYRGTMADALRGPGGWRRPAAPRSWSQCTAPTRRCSAALGLPAAWPGRCSLGREW